MEDDGIIGGDRLGLYTYPENLIGRIDLKKLPTEIETTFLDEEIESEIIKL